MSASRLMGSLFDAGKAPVVVSLAREQIGRQEKAELLVARLSMTTSARLAKHLARTKGPFQ